MLIIIGAIVVFASTIGGFMIAGGSPAVLLHVSEFVVILGVAAGVLIIASPGHILKEITHKLLGAISGKSATRADFFELLKLLYEIFMVGRRHGLIALEEHVMNPQASNIFQKYPSVLGHHERLQFLINGLKPVIDGKIKPDQLEELMTAEIDAKEEEWNHPVHILQLVGDSLPGIGIVAAVLGIINTMAAISDGPEKVGERVAAALTASSTRSRTASSSTTPPNCSACAASCRPSPASPKASLRSPPSRSPAARSTAPSSRAQANSKPRSRRCHPSSERLMKLRAESPKLRDRTLRRSARAAALNAQRSALN